MRSRWPPRIRRLIVSLKAGSDASWNHGQDGSDRGPGGEDGDDERSTVGAGAIPRRWRAAGTGRGHQRAVWSKDVTIWTVPPLDPDPVNARPWNGRPRPPGAHVRR